MREVSCAACQAKAPMNEAFSLADRHFCQPCLEKFLAEPDADTKAGEIVRLLDPTVCANCGADEGDREWPELAGMPTCTSCETFFRNRPYPKWLKIAFVVFLVVAVGAFIYNLRFFLGYVAILRAQDAMDAGDLKGAAHWHASAARRLPEIPELTAISDFFHAQELLTENKNEEALQLLNQAKPKAPPDWQAMFMHMERAAKIGVAFDSKDYDKFLELSQEAAQSSPEDPMAVLSVASAYACKHAESGSEQDRERCLTALERAKLLASDAPEQIATYENRIQHRLETREVISGEEFAKRFPNGWKPEEKP